MTLLIDTLESRRLMSASLDAATGVLTVNGTDANDVIVVTLENSKIKVVDNGATKSFDPAKIKSIKVYGKAGGDTIDVKPVVTKPTTLDAGTNPTFGPFSDKVYGGGGKDTIYLRGAYSFADSRGGDDTVHVLNAECAVKLGAGNDKVIGGYGGSILDGGTGNDTVDWSSSKHGVIMQNGPAGNYYPGTEATNSLKNLPVVYGDGKLIGFENFTGGQGKDFIIGTDAANVIKGNAGDDQIDARGGADKAYGGLGNDALFGGAGNDYLQGDAGNDYLFGEGGKDAMFGNDGNDSFMDVLDGYADYYSGGLGTDGAEVDNGFDVTVGIENVA